MAAQFTITSINYSEENNRYAIHVTIGGCSYEPNNKEYTIIEEYDVRYRPDGSEYSVHRWHSDVPFSDWTLKILRALYDAHGAQQEHEFYHDFLEDHGPLTGSLI